MQVLVRCQQTDECWKTQLRCFMRALDEAATVVSSRLTPVTVQQLVLPYQGVKSSSHSASESTLECAAALRSLRPFFVGSSTTVDQMLCLRQYSQIAGPFLELVQSLRVLHLQPQRSLSTEAPGDSPSSSSSNGQQTADQGTGNAVDAL